MSVVYSFGKLHTHFAVKAFVSAFCKGFADLFHKGVVKIKIVKHAKAHAEKLAGFKQMTYVCSCVALTNGAIALRIDWAGISLVFIVIEIHMSAPGE